MIIQREDDTLLVVRQTDHMAQVARIAEHWGNRQFPAPEHREEAIRAAGLHDNGWRDWEEQPTLVPETRRPRNLGELPVEVHAAFYGAGVERAVAIDPYTGLLVSLHALQIYAGVENWDLEELLPPDRDDLDDVRRAFVRAQVALQRKLRQQLAASPRYARSIEPARLWPAYLRLRAWDSTSLFFLFYGMQDTTLDRVPIADGQTSIALRKIADRVGTATPWPFNRDEVTFPVVASRVPDRAYASGDDFLRTLAAARPELLEYTLRRS